MKLWALQFPDGELAGLDGVPALWKTRDEARNSQDDYTEGQRKEDRPRPVQVDLIVRKRES